MVVPKFPAVFVSTMVVAAVCSMGNVWGATTYYVAKTGSDGNSCTQAKSSSTPKLTVKSGLSCLVSGDTLAIGAGTYAEGLTSTNGVTIPSGSSTAYTKIIGNGGVRGTVFLAPTKAQTGVIALYGTGSYIEFNGIGGDGSNWGSLDWPGCCGPQIGGETDSSSIHHIRVLNGEFKNNRCGSVGMNKASDIEIIGNHFHDDQCNSFSHGMYVGDNLKRIIIDGNIVEGYTDYGIQLYSTSCPCVSDSVVRNNIFRNNGAQWAGSGMSVGGTNNLVYNNIVYGNNASGIRIQYAGAYNVQVYNNTTYNNGDYGIYNVNGSNSVIKNNIVWKNHAGTIISLSGDILSNNLTVDPLFVNPSAGDFHLQAGSPAKDVGVALSTVTSGFDGTSRPQGCCYDAGAYEYPLTSETTTTVSAPKNLRIVP